MITETYREIEIVLLEDENKWRFTANGRERSAPTLPKAREYIDTALDAVATEKVKPFKRIPVYYLDSYPDTLAGLDMGEITSIIGTEYGELRVWTKLARRGREKHRLRSLCVASPENEALFQELRNLDQQLSALKATFREKAAQIKRVELED